MLKRKTMKTRFRLRLKYKILIALIIIIILVHYQIFKSRKISTSGRNFENEAYKTKFAKIINQKQTGQNYSEDELNINKSTNNFIEQKNVTNKIKILCLILTQTKNFKTRVHTVNRTWAKDFDKYLFVTKMDNGTPTNESIEFSEPYPILQPKNHDNENYLKLTDKVFKAIIDIYLKYDDYDWYFKADDDTFVFVDHLRLFLKDKNSSKPVTYGFDCKVVFQDYHSGGAGYVMSKEAFKRLGSALANNYNFCSNTGYEDVDVAECLRRLNTFSEKSLDEYNRERFHPFNITTHLLTTYDHGHRVNPFKNGVDSFSETTITFHYMSPEITDKLYSLWNKYKNNQNKNFFIPMLFETINIPFH